MTRWTTTLILTAVLASTTLHGQSDTAYTNYYANGKKSYQYSNYSKYERNSINVKKSVTVKREWYENGKRKSVIKTKSIVKKKYKRWPPGKMIKRIYVTITWDEDGHKERKRTNKTSPSQPY